MPRLAEDYQFATSEKKAASPSSRSIAGVAAGRASTSRSCQTAATSHKGMGISARDWEIFLGHLRATLDKFRVPEGERREVLAFVESTRAAIVEK